MNEEEIKEWDNALLDLLNKGLIEVAETEAGKKGFRLKRIQQEIRKLEQ